jgi:hypothetical protein
VIVTAVAEMARPVRVSFVRHKNDVYGPVPTDLFYEPLDGSDELLRYKGMLYRRAILNNASEKIVGAVGSSSRVGQAVQAAGSIALPGNVSPARSPVRSGIARALTPGGGSGRGSAAAPTRGYRCPEGFQFGGRFTDANFSTCGKQLFDIPSLRETLAQAVFRTRSFRVAAAPAASGGRGTVLRGAEAPAMDDLMIRRAANVGRVGPMSEKARSSAVKEAAEALANQDSASAVLVRRDGFVMVPVVSAEELRGVPDNRNMEGAAWVQSVRNADAIGRDELGFLSNTGVTTLTYVTPNGVRLTLDRTRDLSTGERRQLGKDVNTAADMSVDDDPAARLKFLADESDGAFEFSQDFGDVENPEKTETSGEGKGKPRWVVDAFINPPEERVEQAAEQDAGDGEEEQPDADQPVAPTTGERITSIKEGVEHLNKGGLLADLAPAIVAEALRRSDRYEEQELRDDFSLFTAEDGRRIILKENNVDFEALGAHYSSELLREMGVQAPAVKFAGEGDDKPFAFRSPDGVIEDAELDPRIDPDEIPAEVVLGTQIADWLSDTRGRSAASVLGVRSGGQVDAVVTIGPPAALIGLSEDEIAERRQIGPESFFGDSTEAYGRNLGEVEEQRNLMLELVDSLIERARAFNFVDYRNKLEIDGTLSENELRHLDIVETIYELRLDALDAQKEAVLQILGLMDES